MIYKWKSGSRVPVEADVAGVELMRIRDDRGRLTPEDVRDEARVEDAPLHPAFEWDDFVAAEAHRLDQARYLLRSIVVMVERDGVEHEVRAFVVVNRDEGEREFESIVTVMKDEDLRRQVLVRAYSEWQSFTRKYRELEELSDLLAIGERTFAATVGNGKALQ